MAGYFGPRPSECAYRGGTVYISFAAPIMLVRGQGAYRAGEMVAATLADRSLLHFAYDAEFAEAQARACTALCLGLLAASLLVHMLQA